MAEQQITLPAWFGNHMILQQKVRIRVYGKSCPNSEIRLTLERFPSGEMLSSGDTEYGIVFQESDFAEEDGFFEFKLPFIEASFDPFRLTVEAAGQRLVYEDILFGEVWLSAGSSNMSMPVSDSDVQSLLPEISKVSGLRFFTQNQSGLKPGRQEYSPVPLAAIHGARWIRSDQTEQVSKLSAVAAAFALQLRKELRIPVAVYDLACPATCIHSWLPREVIERDVIIKNHLREIKHYRDNEHWNELPAPEKKEERGIHKKVDNRDEAAQSPPFSRHNQPGAMFNHKLAPYTTLACRGVIWIQGEEDVQYPDYYRRAFHAFTEVLKEMLQSPLTGLSFIYSQLTPRLVSQVDFCRLAYFNEALAVARRKLAIKAGMITVYDLPLDSRRENGFYGTPDTPAAKREVANRMLQTALGLAYKYDLPVSAPECISAEKVGNKLLLSFENVGKGVTLRGGSRLLKGFSICGRDGQYILADAKELYNVRVIVWHDEIKDPLSCSYAFMSFNREANLCSSSGIPVVPFRLERESSLREKPRHWADCDHLEGFRFPNSDPRVPRIGEKSMPGMYPLWKLFSGRGEFKLDTDNKRQGTASLLLSYRKADERPLLFGPVLDYASDYPPLDLHLWDEMVMHVFNAEHRSKVIQLRMADANGRETVSDQIEIKDILSWQKIHFHLKNAPVDLMRLTKLSFSLQDPNAEGTLYIDTIEFKGFNPS